MLISEISETVKIYVVNVLIHHGMSEFFAHLDNSFEHFKISSVFVFIQCNSYMDTFKFNLRYSNFLHHFLKSRLEDNKIFLLGAR